MSRDPKDHLFLVQHTASGWGEVRPIRYAGDDVDGRSADQEPHLGPDRHTIYFSSDRGIHVEFPRTHAQAVADLQRLEAWDNNNANVGSLTIATWLS